MKEVNSHVLKDGRWFRVRNTIVVGNVCHILAHLLLTLKTGIMHGILYCNDITMNSDVLMTDLQVDASNKGSKQVGLDVFT
jgi:hypothetical protein